MDFYNNSSGVSTSNGHSAARSSALFDHWCSKMGSLIIAGSFSRNASHEITEIVCPAIDRIETPSNGVIVCHFSESPPELLFGRVDVNIDGTIAPTNLGSFSYAAGALTINYGGFGLGTTAKFNFMLVCGS